MRINRFMLEKLEHRSNIGRLIYSCIEVTSKLSVRISFYESSPSLSLALSLSLSFSWVVGWYDTAG